MDKVELMPVDLMMRFHFNGIVYSRYSYNYISVDEAIREFVSLIDGTEESDEQIH